jgi:hypothetical protein
MLFFELISDMSVAGISIIQDSQFPEQRSDLSGHGQER